MSNIAKNDKTTLDYWDSPNQTPRWLRGTCLWTSVCVCVCSMSVWESSAPPSCSTNSPREGGAGRAVSSRSCGLSLKGLKYVLEELMVCSSTFSLSPPKTTSTYSAKPRNLSLFPTLRKKTMTVHPTNNLCSQTCTLCALTHIPPSPPKTKSLNSDQGIIIMLKWQPYN